MRRADRLFRLVELLRSRHLSTGAWLAEQLQVSLRTLYRDISDLTLSGVPVEGEAGVGYRLRHKMGLPPLLFDMGEDPGETQNLADDPAHRDVMLDYAQKMLSWRLRHADRTLTGMHLTSKGVVSRR